jgi:zinc transporter 1/2/3
MIHHAVGREAATLARWVFLLVIFVASLAGVAFPFYAVRRWSLQILEAKWFALLRAFATGLVCGVACLHILPDANEYLSSLPDFANFPVANCVMLAGAFLMVVIKEIGLMLMDVLTHQTKHDAHFMDAESALDTSLLVYESPRSDSSESMDEHVGAVGHRHSHASIELHGVDFRKSLGKRVMVYAMEASIAVHAVLIGLGLGVLRGSWMSVATLGTALVIHQLFEGIALGTSAVKAGLNLSQALHLVLTFTCSCPLGVALGIFLDHCFTPKDPNTALVLGVLNALAAGTLMHIGFVELLAEDFSEESGRKHSRAWIFKTFRLMALFAGGTVMAVLAVWA